MIEPKVEKISESEFRLTDDSLAFLSMGESFVYEGIEYQIKEVVASNSDNSTFDVTVR